MTTLQDLMAPHRSPAVRRSALLVYLLVMAPLILWELVEGILKGTWRVLWGNRGMYQGWVTYWWSHYRDSIAEVWRSTP